MHHMQRKPQNIPKSTSSNRSSYWMSFLYSFVLYNQTTLRQCFNAMLFLPYEIEFEHVNVGYEICYDSCLIQNVFC